MGVLRGAAPAAQSGADPGHLRGRRLGAGRGASAADPGGRCLAGGVPQAAQDLTPDPSSTVLLEEIARTSVEVAKTPARLAKIERLAATLRRLRAEEVPVAVAYLSGELPQGSIGIGWASLRDLPPPAELPPTLLLLEVHGALGRIRASTGPGSQAARRAEL